jgi:Holliday junction resolvase RusA-like endonuclease
MLTLTLPVAPPANNAFSNRKGGRGRFKSAKYRAWLKQADAHYLLHNLRQGSIRGPYRCWMIFPRIRGDLDGRAKLILDWMVSRQLTSDDKFLQGLLLGFKAHAPAGYVTVKVMTEDEYARSLLPSAAALPE